MCVCLSLQICLEHSIFIYLAKIFKQTEIKRELRESTRDYFKEDGALESDSWSLKTCSIENLPTFKLLNSTHSFHFIFHFLVSWKPDDWDDCQHTEPCQWKVNCVVDFQKICRHADDKCRQVEETKGTEPSWYWDIFLKYSLVLIKLISYLLMLHTTWFCNPWAGFWSWITGVSFVGIRKLIIFLPQTSSIMTILWRMKLMLVGAIKKYLRTVTIIHVLSSENEQ